MKKSFHLIGSNSAEEWVVTRKDRPDLLFGMSELDLISATELPLLFYHQLPLKWLTQDPGFPILLRSAVEKELPPWIYPPMIDVEQKGPCYRFIPRASAHRKKNSDHLPP